MSLLFDIIHQLMDFHNSKPPKADTAAQGQSTQSDPPAGLSCGHPPTVIGDFHFCPSCGKMAKAPPKE